MKIVYIAHPISGDVEGNVNLILYIVKEINMTMANVVPFAPYLVDVLALDDSQPEQRSRGFKNNKALFDSGLISEVWLYGGRISSGMQTEIDWAAALGINVIKKY